MHRHRLLQMGKDSLGLIFAVSASSKFLWKYSRVALAVSVHYGVQLKRGTYIHIITFVVLLKTVKTAKVQPSKAFPVYSSYINTMQSSIIMLINENIWYVHTYYSKLTGYCTSSTFIVHIQSSDWEGAEIGRHLLQ